jgi:hypothetical protein
LDYAEDVIMMDKNTNTIQKNTEALGDWSGSKCRGTKHMGEPLQQNVQQNHNFLIVNKFFGCVKKFRYLGTTVTN